METGVHAGLKTRINGNTKRYLDLFKSKKEMVAGPPHHCIIVAWYFDRFGRHCPRAIYLHFILRTMTRNKVLETILVLVLALMVFYRITHNGYFFLLAIIVGAIGLFIPVLAEKIHVAWMKLAELLGAVTSKIILTIIFFIVLVPVSFLFRAFGKNGVQKKPVNNSCFKERNFTYTAESLENVW